MPAADPLPPDDFAGHDVLEPLGAGGHGVVHAAIELRWGRKVALKTLRPGHDPLQLKREFRLLRDLSHPNLVELYELHADGPRPFFTMELLDARPWPAGADTWPELRSLAQQLVAALSFLHRHGITHRDVKPSNVLVTEGGRLVLLDFGVAARPSEARDEEFAGTVAYAAPEQLLGSRPDQRADVYSLGVVLYEALSGRLPFAGSAREIVMTKCGGAVAERLVREDVDAAILDAIQRMLSPQPDARPKLDEVLALLGPATGAAVPLGFGGRQEEIAELDHALGLARDGSQLVWVRGRAGLGKSTLLQKFLGRAADGGALVLEGRCAPNESVRFRAFDGVIDQLTVWLLRRRGVVEGLELDAAARLFPSLGKICDGGMEVASPPEQLRERGEAQVVALLSRVAAEVPVVVAIDDVHWADDDSAGMGRRLMAEAAARPMLVVLATRSAHGEGVGFETAMAEMARDVDVREHQLELRPLSTGDARRLLGESLGGVDDERLGALAQSSGGDPYVLSQIVAAAETSLDGRPADVDALLRARVDGLDAKARALLELCVIAGEALELDLALEHSAAVYDDALGLLRARLLQRTDSDRLAPYHARLQDVLAPRVDPEHATATHRQVAEALRSREARPGRIAHHYLRAGDCDAALPFALDEGRRSASELAFARATRFYRMALDAPELERSPSRRREVERALAEALRAAGQPREAAAMFLRASEGAEERAGLECRRAAADCLLGAGASEEGVALLEAALRRVGYAYPARGISGTAKLVGERMALRVARVTRRVTEPTTRRAPADRAHALDVLWTTAFDLGVVDPIPALALQAQHTREALNHGDYGRVSRGRAVELVYVASTGRDIPREQRLEELVREAVVAVKGDHERAFLWLCLGLTDLYRGRFVASDEALSEAIVGYGDGAIARWELSYARVHRAIVYDHLGRYAELRGTVEGLEGELRRADDRLSGAFLDLGVGYAMDLAGGRLDRARDRLARPLPTLHGEPLPPLDWMRLVATARVELFGGRPQRAEEALKQARRRHLSLFGFQHVRATYWWLRAMAAVHVGDLRRARAALRRLRRDARILSPGVPTLLEAHVAAGVVERERLARQAEAACRQSGWLGYAAGARALHGDPQPLLDELGVEDDRWLRLWGWRGS